MDRASGSLVRTSPPALPPARAPNMPASVVGRASHLVMSGLIINSTVRVRAWVSERMDGWMDGPMDGWMGAGRRGSMRLAVAAWRW
eukprot:COSAG01_NODE_30313_length_618_cov_1.337187_1_plen_85_part_10